MKLIGITTGEYEGNNYAKVIFTEPQTRVGCYGENAIISKINYNYAMSEIVPNWEILKNQEVMAYYDRFGRVSEIKLV